MTNPYPQGSGEWLLYEICIRESADNAREFAESIRLIEDAFDERDIS